jgi:hypothetical protein
VGKGPWLAGGTDPDTFPRRPGHRDTGSLEGEEMAIAPEIVLQ